MNIIICSKCGHIHANTYSKTRCAKCKEPLDYIVCKDCGRIVGGAERSRPKDRQCKKCHSAIETASTTRYAKRKAAEAASRYEAWLKKVRAVPKDYLTLTEAQWQEACRFFNGCARCGSPEIDARVFYVSNKLGGRYCDWNVIPVCSVCNTRFSNETNPYLTAKWKDADAMYRADGAYTYRNCLEKIEEYLGARLDKAIGGNNE